MVYKVELKIGPSKTTMVTFTRRRFLPALRTINLGGREITMTNEVNIVFTLDFPFGGISTWN